MGSGSGYVVGCDLGGTRFRVALADATGRVVNRVSALTEATQGRDAVLARMKRQIRAAIAGIRPNDVAVVAVAAPGPLDPWKGILYHPPNLPGWEIVPIKQILEDDLGVTVRVANDANVAALAELRYGAGQGYDHLIYVTVSTGVGGGVIVRGELLLGARGGAGEIGHMTIDMSGPLCNCGNRGCLEALASGTAIARQAASLIGQGAGSRIIAMVDGDIERVTAKAVVEAARLGDSLGLRVMHQAGYALGVGMANLMHLYDPQLIIIGGGVSNAGSLLFDPMNQAIQERAMEPYRQRIRVIQSELGDDVGVLGAVALALSQSHRG